MQASRTDTDIGIVTTLRKLIISGHYHPGERLTESAVADTLGVSRTPVRLAFRTLEQEGLLQKTGRRGLVVRAFSEDDVLCGLEVRGALEGLAARRLAERGLSSDLHARLTDCIARGRNLLAQGQLTADGVAVWSALNLAFHSAIIEGAGSTVIADAIARNDHLPFASADSIIIDSELLDREYEKLRFAQLQHELVLDALERGESARVENLMREHANIGLRYANLFGLPAAAFPNPTVKPKRARSA